MQKLKKEDAALWLSITSLLVAIFTLAFLWDSQRFGKLVESVKGGFAKMTKKKTGDRA